MPRGVKRRAGAAAPRPAEHAATVWAAVACGSAAAAQEFDLTVACAGGRLRCHRAVLATASTFLGQLLRGAEVQGRDGAWVAVGRPELLVLDQVQVADLRRLLCLLYNGFADVTLDAAADLKEVWKHLDINIVRWVVITGGDWS